MRNQRAFHFSGAETVTGNIDDIVNATGDPVIAVLVAASAVAGEVLAGIGLEVSVDETLVIAEYGAHLAGP